MAFPFPRHEDGTMNFKAYDQLSKELKMEAAFDIRDNYPEDLAALGAHLLAENASRAAEEAELEAGIKEDEEKAARLENKLPHLENKLAYLENKEARLEKRHENLLYQREQQISKDVKKISRGMDRKMGLNDKNPQAVRQRKPSGCAIL